MRAFAPQKLRPGDEIRVIAPAMSMGIISQEVRANALRRFAELELKVTFSKHCEECDLFFSSSIDSRISDLHAAFDDPNVKGILTIIGGFNSIQLLPYLNYGLIKQRPKIFCGYSDITALQNAIHTKTGLITYSGPHYSTFGCVKGLDYLVEAFKRMLFSQEPMVYESSPSWSDDEWYIDQEARVFEGNSGPWILRSGVASGTILGGNINALNSLQGTEYMPSLDNSVLFLEDDALATPELFDRCLSSLTLQEGFGGVKGIVIGRFQRTSKITRELMEKIILSNRSLGSIPIIANIDFGHTLPMITFPIGGKVEIIATQDKAKISFRDSYP
jgi:muramoyltetrapeptide carboxypeptidase LdcA involved in peptidoglycan recycling